MRRVLLVGALLALIATPAVATHVQEPTTPLIGHDLVVLHYTNPRVVAPCDGSEFAFQNIRIEQYIRVNALPSEHFDALLQVRKHVLGPGGAFLAYENQWGAEWRHSNAPPHNPSGGPVWRTVGDRTNTWIREPGTYSVRSVVTGLESGSVFEEVCTFIVPPGAAE